MGISGWQLILVLVIVFVLFGAGKLPRVMGDLGKGVRSMKDGLKGEGEDDSLDGDKVQKVKDGEKKAVSAQQSARVIDVEEEVEAVPAAPKKAVKKKAPAKKAVKKPAAKTKASAKKVTKKAPAKKKSS